MTNSQMKLLLDSGLGADLQKIVGRKAGIISRCRSSNEVFFEGEATITGLNFYTGDDGSVDRSSLEVHITSAELEGYDYHCYLTFADGKWRLILNGMRVSQAEVSLH